MLTIKISGGLGNQMFEYAYIKALSLRQKEKFFIDNHNTGKYDRKYKLDIFNIKEKIIDYKDIPRYEKLGSNNHIISNIYNIIKWIGRLINKNHYRERKVSPIDKVLGLNHENFDLTIKRMREIKKGYIEGIFQTEKYFEDFKNDILKDLTFKKDISKKTKEMGNVIQNTESVGIHIRRGDYLQKYRLKRLGTCKIDYYKKAIHLLKRKYKKASFFFFSDDIKRCKENFNEKNSHYIDWNKGDDDWQDMYLLHLCKNNIIGNSTFARRGAYLNKNPKKIIICPKKWDILGDSSFKYIIPSSKNRIKI